MGRIGYTLLRLKAMIAKEFLAVFKDPRNRAVLLGPPILQFFIFGYAATFELRNVRYAVLDQDRSPASRRLLAGFAASDTFRLEGVLTSDQEITRRIDNREVRLVLHVPQEFSRNLAAGKPASLQVILDGRNSNAAAVAMGYVNEIVRRYNLQAAGSPVAVIPASAGGKDAGGLPHAVQTAAIPPASIRSVGRAWFNENLQSRWFIVSALAVQITTVIVVTLTSLSVSREREFGTFDQLLVAPFRSWEILLAKSLPPMAVGLIDALLLSLAGVFWYGVPFRGSILALVVMLAVFMVCLVGVGLFMSSLAATMQQSLLAGFMFIMPAVILSGFTTAIENMPHWLQVVTWFNPLRYAVAACRDLFLQGGTLGTIWPQLWPMLLIATFTLPLAGWFFHHRTA